MFRFVTSSIICIIFVFVGEIFPGWVTGKVLFRYVGGIPPQYLYSCNWVNSYGRQVKLVEPGDVVVDQSTFGTSCSNNQYYLEHEFNENIIGDKIYGYAYKMNPSGVYEEYAGTMVVNTNGGVQDFYLDNYSYSFVDNLVASMGYGNPPNPFGDPVSIDLEWEYNGYEITKFFIERKVNGGSWAQIAQVNASQLSYIDNTVQPGNYYYYRVRGALIMPHNAHYTYIKYSNMTTVTFLLSTPQNLQMNANPGNGLVRLTWNANPESDIDSYEISRKIEEYGTGWITVATTANTYYVDPEMYYAPTGGLVHSHYKIRAKDTQGIYSPYSSEVTARTEPMYKKKGGKLAENLEYNLAANYPNPFNPSTQINYSIKENGFVSLKVFDILGNEVATLVDEHKPAGNYQVKFDASHLSGSVYFYRIRAGDFVSIKKMILLK